MTKNGDSIFDIQVDYVLKGYYDALAEGAVTDGIEPEMYHHIFSRDEAKEHHPAHTHVRRRREIQQL